MDKIAFLSLLALTPALADQPKFDLADVHVSKTARGFAQNDTIFDDVIPRIEEALEAARGNGVTDTYELQQVIRRIVGKWVGGKLRRRPMIIPVVIAA